MRTRRQIFIPFLIALILLGGVAIRMHRARRPGPAPRPPSGSPSRPPAVEVRPAVRGDIAHTLHLVGEVVATDSVVISATKEGVIVSAPWREGDAVTRGDILIEVGREVLRAEVQAAEAALDVARARLRDVEAGTRIEEIERAEAAVRRWEATREDAAGTLRRQEELLAEDFTSRQAADQARERLAVADAELASTRANLRMLRAGPTPTALAVQASAVQEAEARLALASAHLAESVVAAPFDGIISRAHVRAGDLSVPRGPLLEMYAPDSLALRFAVPEAQAASVRPGLPVEASLDAWPGRTVAAEVTRVHPKLDPSMRTRAVEAALADPHGLAPHMFARVNLALRQEREAVLVPADALRTGPSGARHVFVVEDGVAVSREVEIGIETRDAVQVLHGVAAGDLLVVRGQEILETGMSVRVTGDRP